MVSFAFLFFSIALIGIRALDEISLIFHFVSHTQRMPVWWAGHIQSMNVNFNNERKGGIDDPPPQQPERLITIWICALKSDSHSHCGGLMSSCLLLRSVNYLGQNDWKYPYISYLCKISFKKISKKEKKANTTLMDWFSKSLKRFSIRVNRSGRQLCKAIGMLWLLALGE